MQSDCLVYLRAVPLRGCVTLGALLHLSDLPCARYNGDSWKQLSDGVMERMKSVDIVSAGAGAQGHARNDGPLLWVENEADLPWKLWSV